MSAASDRRQGRRSLARRRAETHSSGFQTTTLKLPEGVGFYTAEKGKAYLDILPYKVGKGNENADPGEEYYERTFYQYRKLGVDEKSYVCPSKTFKDRDPVAELRQTEVKKPEPDTQLLKDLTPKERQIFLIYDRKNTEKGVQLWDISYHNFGKLLDSRLKNSDEERGWDWFYDAGEDGFTLEITFDENPHMKFIEATAIDFVPRKTPIPKNIANHGICLDDLLVRLSYDELRRILYNISPDDEEGGSHGEPDEIGSRGDENGETKSKSSDSAAEGEKSKSRDPEDWNSKEEITEGGYLAGKKGKPSDKNPFKKDTKEHAWWSNGWEAGVEDAGKSEKKESKEKPTPESMGIKRGDDVSYKGKRHSFLRATEDGVATILDADDEPVKVSLEDITKWGESGGDSQKVEKEKEPPKKDREEEKSTRKDESPKQSEKDEAPWDDKW